MDLQRKEQVQYLLMRWLTAKSSPKEETLLFRILEEERNDPEWEALLEDIIASETDLEGYNREEWQPMIEAITRKKAPVRRMRPWIKWVAAACILAAVAVLALVFVGVPANKRGPKPVATTHDVQAPNETRAVITLANGQKVYLDSVENGTIAQESNVNVVKTEDGKIAYNAVTLSTSDSLRPKGLEGQTAYNTLFNPRGSKVIDMTLSDGSHVWLNSGSSIKYPVAFIGKERVVEITGEAYFEVKHNAQQPFKVHLPNGSIVEDIGTSFNINAYSDEADIKTTLIEGSVKVTLLSPAGGGGLSASPDRKRPGVDRGVILEPGQQALVNFIANGAKQPRIEVQTADVEAVLAWKNGKFDFGEKTDLQTIMRQIARWYDVDVEFKGNVPQQYIGGSVSMNVNISDVLKILEASTGVKFKIEGKKVIVSK